MPIAQAPLGTPGAASSLPSLARRVSNLTTAVARWVAAGRPVRTFEQVRAIYEAHCARCPMLVGGKCRLCGCGCSAADSLANKLRMATEGCPKEPPEFGPQVGGSC